MKKGSFENQWKTTLLNHEEKVPVDFWGKIEEELDAEKSMEVMIRHKMLTGSVTPSNKVWARIEAELNKKERRPFLYFSVNRRALAGIAALLLVALGFGIYQIDFRKSASEVSEVTGDASLNKIRSLPTSEVPAPLSALSKERQVRATPIPSVDNQKLKESTLVHDKGSSYGDANPLPASDTERENPVIDEKSLLADLTYMTGKAFNEFGNSIILRRNKLGYETPEKFLDDNRTFLQRSWFSLISGISPFNPNIRINNFERAALVSASDVPRSSFNSIAEPTVSAGKRETFAIPLSQPYNEIRTGTAINLGFDYGKRLGKFLSIESGLRYSSGQSMVGSNVYSYNQFTGNVRTFLESYYIRKDQTVFDNTVISTKAYIDNDYRFVNLPVQLGFYLPVTSKMEAAVTGGVSGDFIISNVLDNLAEGGSRLTAANSAYKVVNLSGIGSLKINYMVSKDWQVSLGSNIQQTLTTGVEKSEGFSFKPRYIGLYTSINYRFH